MIFWLFGQDFCVRIKDFRAQLGCKAMDGLVDLVELAGEIAGGGGDGGDAQGGAVPDDAVVEFGDGEVEAVAELVFYRAEDLAAVFQGLSVRDLQFDDEFGYGHFFGRASLPRGYFGGKLLILFYLGRVVVVKYCNERAYLQNIVMKRVMEPFGVLESVLPT